MQSHCSSYYPIFLEREREGEGEREGRRRERGGGKEGEVGKGKGKGGGEGDAETETERVTGNKSCPARPVCQSSHCISLFSGSRGPQG